MFKNQIAMEFISATLYIKDVPKTENRDVRTCHP